MADPVPARSTDSDTARISSSPGDDDAQKLASEASSDAIAPSPSSDQHSASEADDSCGAAGSGQADSLGSGYSESEDGGSARIDPERARFQVIREARRLVSDHPEADFAFVRGRLLETTRGAGARRSSLEFSADDVDEARVEIESFLQPKSRVKQTDAVPLVTATRLYNRLSDPQTRLFVLDVREVSDRSERGVVPRSVLLSVPHTTPNDIKIETVQSWLPGRKEKLTFRSFRLFCAIIVGKSHSAASLAGRVATAMHGRLIPGGRGSVSVLRGGFSSFIEKYPKLVIKPEGKAGGGGGKGQPTVMGGVPPSFMRPCPFPAEILEGLVFLGSHQNCSNKSVLESLGIKRIVYVTRHTAGLLPHTHVFEYVRMSMGTGEEVLDRVAQIVRVTKMEHDSGTPTGLLIAGPTGRCCAVAIAVSFVMRERMCSLHEAYNAVKAERRALAMSRRRWVSLSRFEQDLVKLDTLEACVVRRALFLATFSPIKCTAHISLFFFFHTFAQDLSTVPADDPPEPPSAAEVKSSALTRRDSQLRVEVFKASKVRWAVDSFLQDKCQQLAADCERLISRRDELQNENSRLVARVSALEEQTKTLRKSRQVPLHPDGTSTGSMQELMDELEGLRRALKDYGARLVRLGSVD